jgi:hypothetical protein
MFFFGGTAARALPAGRQDVEDDNTSQSTVRRVANRWFFIVLLVGICFPSFYALATITICVEIKISDRFFCSGWWNWIFFDLATGISESGKYREIRYWVWSGVPVQEWDGYLPLIFIHAIPFLIYAIIWRISLTRRGQINARLSGIRGGLCGLLVGYLVALPVISAWINTLPPGSDVAYLFIFLIAYNFALAAGAAIGCSGARVISKRL